MSLFLVGLGRVKDLAASSDPWVPLRLDDYVAADEECQERRGTFANIKHQKLKSKSFQAFTSLCSALVFLIVRSETRPTGRLMPTGQLGRYFPPRDAPGFEAKPRIREPARRQSGTGSHGLRSGLMAEPVIEVGDFRVRTPNSLTVSWFFLKHEPERETSARDEEKVAVFHTEPTGLRPPEKKCIRLGTLRKIRIKEHQHVQAYSTLRMSGFGSFVQHRREA